MKIAVTYDNGNIFQHFGRTEQFKVYEVEDNKIVSSEVVGSDGIGHGALAGLLAGHDIAVLICGGLGGGAMNALMNAGIEVCAGASGSADEAVEAYLKGELVNTGANCDHHRAEKTTDAAAEAVPAIPWKAGMSERMSGSTTRALSTTAHSSTPPMTAASRWRSSAAQA